MTRPVKRIVLVVLSLLGVFVGTMAAVVGSAFAGNAALPETGPIAGGKAILVKDGYVSMYLVPTTEGHALAIDAGDDKGAKALDAVLAERKLTLDAFFITHGHPDHLGGCLKYPNVPVYALADEVDIIAGTKGTHGLLPGLMGPSGLGVKVLHLLKDGDVSDVGGKAVRAFAVPGHTQGSAAYLVDGVLFFGDTAGQSSQGAVKRAPWVFSDDSSRAAESIRALGKRLTPPDVQFFAFAHSGPMAADLGKLEKVE